MLWSKTLAKNKKGGGQGWQDSVSRVLATKQDCVSSIPEHTDRREQIPRYPLTALMCQGTCTHRTTNEKPFFFFFILRLRMSL